MKCPATSAVLLGLCAVVCTAAPTSLAADGDDAASLTVHVPAGADLWVNGRATRFDGPVRQFFSRGLEPGREYPYDIRAVLARDGRRIERRKRVILRAGESRTVRFDFEGRDEPWETYRVPHEGWGPTRKIEPQAPPPPDVAPVGDPGPAPPRPKGPGGVPHLAARPDRTVAGPSSSLAELLAAGRLDEAQKLLVRKLRDDPASAELRGRLAAVRFVSAVERLGQSLGGIGTCTKACFLPPDRSY